MNLFDLNKTIVSVSRRLCMAVICFICLVPVGRVYAQSGTHVNARIDAKQLTIGDQARLFIEAQNDPAAAKLQWATIPDTFDHLEVVERGKIDTIKQGSVVTYRQRLLITGFDSGMFRIPAFVFSVIPNAGTVYTVQTDSFDLLVQSVAVDTTKAFKPIKGVIYVKSTWRDYIWVIIGVAIFLILLAVIIIYFTRTKKVIIPKPQGPAESLQDHTLRLLAELDKRELWQKKQVKEYYVALTDIVRNYIEMRFQTQVMELTTDELLSKAEMSADLQPYRDILADILQTADLAKFAKAQPLPQEHVGAMVKARQFVDASRPVIAVAPQDNAGKQSDDDSKAG